MNSKGFGDFRCPTGWPGLAGRVASAGRPAGWPAGQETWTDFFSLAGGQETWTDFFFAGRAARRHGLIFLPRGRPGRGHGLILIPPAK